MKGLLFAVIAPFALTVVIGCNSSTPATPGATSVDRVVVRKEAANVPGDAPPVETGLATEPMEGFVLISPLRSTETYLVNLDKEVVHRWKSEYPPANSAYLMENGDLLRGARDPDFSHFSGGGVGAMIEKYNWDGELLWTFRYASEDHCAHHDIAPLPNGNVLMIAWERKSKDEAIAQGRDPDLLKDNLWPDHVIEVQPAGPTGGKIVWEWHMWNHLVQDFDRDKPNYGVIYEHPELIDLNNFGSTPPSTPEELRKLRAVGYTGGSDDDDSNHRRTGSDWLHTNAIDYNPALDQIALSAKNFSEIWVIDHSTTTEEAASHRGGRSGKGGDLLYRWGNSWSYKSGTSQEKMLFDQHDVRWIPPGLPGAGNITAFNNGSGREFSSVIEIEPPMDGDGSYILDDEGRYGPYQLAWEYTADNKKDFYSGFISGATRLPNGNTFICEGATGRYFEVNSEGNSLWEHTNTFGGELDMDGHPNDVEQEARKLLEGDGKRSFVENNALFRVAKYEPSYAALAGKTLEPLAEQPVPFAALVADAVARLQVEMADKTESEQVESEAGGEDEAQPSKDSEEPSEVGEPVKGAELEAVDSEPAATTDSGN
jgi:hypothetical protein